MEKAKHLHAIRPLKMPIHGQCRLPRAPPPPPPPAAATVKGKAKKSPSQFGNKWATEDPPEPPHVRHNGELEVEPGRGARGRSSESQFGHRWARDDDRPYGGSGRRPDGGLDARPPLLSRERDYSQFGRKWATEDDPASRPRRPLDQTWVRRRVRKAGGKKKAAATTAAGGKKKAGGGGGGGGKDDGGDGDDGEDGWFDDESVLDGRGNPSVYLPAGPPPARPKPADAIGGKQPPPTSECPALICDPLTLEKRGVHTGERFRQWSDRLGSTDGLEDSYSVGPAPMREWRSTAGMYDDILGGDQP
jgi:hypothetical protein